MNAYNYFRTNVAGVREWWYHRSGCRAWFQAERDTTTNQAAGRPPEGMSRLPPRPGERLNRDRHRVTFEAGLLRGRHGRRPTASRCCRAASSTTGRAGSCCSGKCPNCLVDVDGWPGVRACTEPVREGMKVEHMNARPSLRFDVMRGDRSLRQAVHPPGFYYKTFIRPRRLWPTRRPRPAAFRRTLRRAATAALAG